MATTFDPAGHRSVYSRLARVVAGEGRSRELLPLEEATERLRPFARRYLGLRAVPLGQIVGTDSRGRDFDREFRPRRPGLLGWR
ncbi:MAG: chromosome partitioning protein ParB, partial [Gaiellaceae bacterium]